MNQQLPCEQVETSTAEYLDDALPTHLRRRFELHLGGCAECWAHLESIRWTIDRLASLPPETMPPEMKERLLAAAPSSTLPSQHPPSTTRIRWPGLPVK